MIALPSPENIELGRRIRQRRQDLGQTQGDVAAKVGVAISTIQRYEAGTIDRPKLAVIQAIAKAISVNPDWLVGKTDNPEIRSTRFFASNIVPLPAMKKIPLVGQIACGTPILAEQNVADYVDLPSHIRADFALTCKGESMIGAGIRDGDVVYIRQQEEVENGQIAAVMVGDEEATLKRFYLENGVIQLVAENPTIPPKAFIGESIEQIRVVGLAVAYTHVIE